MGLHMDRCYFPLARAGAGGLEPELAGKCKTAVLIRLPKCLVRFRCASSVQKFACHITARRAATAEIYLQFREPIRLRFSHK